MKPVGLGMNAAAQPPPAVESLTWQCPAVRTFVVVVVVVPLVMEPRFLSPPLPCRPPQLALMPLQPVASQLPLPWDKEMPRLRSRWLWKQVLLELDSFALADAFAVMVVLALSFLPRGGVSNDTRFIIRTMVNKLMIWESKGKMGDWASKEKRKVSCTRSDRDGEWVTELGECWSGLMVYGCRISMSPEYKMVQECSVDGWYWYM
jgi:hypothetical protein